MIYSVQKRSATTIAGLNAAKHGSDEKELVVGQIEAGSSTQALAEAVSAHPESGDAELFFVGDNRATISVFWPSGTPVQFERYETPWIGDLECFLAINDRCEGRGTPPPKALFVEGDARHGGEWVCESCASMLVDRP